MRAKDLKRAESLNVSPPTHVKVERGKSKPLTYMVCGTCDEPLRRLQDTLWWECLSCGHGLDIDLVVPILSESLSSLKKTRKIAKKLKKGEKRWGIKRLFQSKQ